MPRRGSRIKTCGHFRTHWTKVISAAGTEFYRHCSACGCMLEARRSAPPGWREVTRVYRTPLHLM